jgi:hypothetical protein
MRQQRPKSAPTAANSADDWCVAPSWSLSQEKCFGSTTAGPPVRAIDQPQIHLSGELLKWRVGPVKEMHTPVMWDLLPAFNYVPRYSVDLALPLRANIFDNVVVVKARMHEAQFYDF